MKYLFLSFSTIIILIACQSKPTKTDSVPGGLEDGFLPPPVWNASMQNLKRDMLTLEPYIFSKDDFNDPKNREFLSKEIHRIAAEAQNVKHDPVVLTKDPTVRFVAAGFADELKRADENFKTGWFEYSRGQLAKVTSYCLECHTRSNEGAHFKSNETVRPYLTTLSVSERMEFMIAFRQFEPAYNLGLEKLKLIVEGQKQALESDRIVSLSLLVSVQYMQDLEKAKKVVSTVKKNSSLPTYLKNEARLWQKSLDQWDPNSNLNTLPGIRNFLNHRKSEIDDMRAIPSLLALLTEGLNREELGETLVLTGETYESLKRVSILSLHKNYYESCVRKAPRTKWAKICFKKFTDSVNLDYTGSGGTRIPTDIKKQVDDLKNVIER